MAEPTSTPAPASPTGSSTPPAASGLVVTCQCGHVRFRTSTPRPIDLVHCHCTECRRQSGSPFGTSVYFPPGEGFYPLSADVAARVGVFTRPTDSGNTMHCYFCKQCGVRLLHAVILPDGSIRPTVSVKGGCIEDPDKVLNWAAAKHIFVRSAVTPLLDGWETYEGAIPRRPTSTAAAAPARGEGTKAKTE